MIVGIVARTKPYTSEQLNTKQRGNVITSESRSFRNPCGEYIILALLCNI